MLAVAFAAAGASAPPAFATLVIADPDPIDDGPIGAPAALTFTSGLPPIGDGNTYPRQLNPGRQSPGGGVAIDSVFTSLGVSFGSTNGNPAFFDDNNLLTAPSSLIVNEAFWTDPKVGQFRDSGGNSFEASSIAFFFDDPAIQSFGFDLAIAAVGGPAVTRVPFSVQNANDEVAGGTIVLEEAFDFFFDEIYAVEANAFNTLQTPFGRDGRFRIDMLDLQDLIASENGGFEDEFGGGFDDPFDSPIIALTLDLKKVSTRGGTTQVAVDNFVIDGGEPFFETERTPIRFQPELLPPGELARFILDPATSQLGDGVNVPSAALVLELELKLIALAARANAAAARPLEAAVTLPAGSDARDAPGLTLQPIESDVAFAGRLGDLFKSVGSAVDVLIEGDPTLEDAILVELDVLLTEGLGDIPLTPADVDQILDGLGASGVTRPGPFPLSEAPEADLAPHEAVHVLQAVGGTGDRAIGEPRVFVKTTLAEYLAIQNAAGLGAVVGDTGSSLVPLTDADGTVIDFLVKTWTVADQGGTFAAFRAVPEPAAGLAAAGLGLGFGLMRRCR